MGQNNMRAKISPINQIGYQGTLVFEDEIPVLGIPVHFRSNRQLVIERVNSALGHWNLLAEEFCDREFKLVVDIITQVSTCKSTSASINFYHWFHGDTYLACQDGNLLSANLGKGKALAFVTPDLLGDEPAFTWFVIEALALILMPASRRVAFHASAVTKAGKGIAFIGRGGAGKSSLAYACLRRGFNLLSEDIIYAGTESDYRIWGNATKIHLLPDSIRLFPELKGRDPRLHPNGKFKIAVPLSEIDSSSPALQVKSITTCLIEPNHLNHDSSLELDSSDYVRDTILSSQDIVFNQHSKYLPLGLEHLLGHDTYRLKVGNDLNAATDLLMNLI